MSIATPSKRILSIDILRGIIMIIMALDHTRDFFSDFRKFDPLDLQHANTFMFFTRWITHFCAPVFVFLAGTSVFLSLSRGKTKKQMAWQLLTRGLWLVILEVTIVRFGWAFNFDYHLIFLQVIWAIGCSMIVLSLLIFLPRQVILFIALTLIFGHNYFDKKHAADLGMNEMFWDFLHVQTRVSFDKAYGAFIIYPLIPWIGVMAAGYCFGAIFKKEEKLRNQWLYGIGIGAILLFILLRFINQYGDPNPWRVQNNGTTILSFLKCAKYPPSLLYLLMTLGPAITLLPILEKISGKAANFFLVYGRVPMFYYILHIYIIHGLALITGIILGMPTKIFTSNGTLFDPNLKWGFSLPVVYLYWIATILILYYPCRWFMRVKATNKKWWLSYL